MRGKASRVKSDGENYGFKPMLEKSKGVLLFISSIAGMEAFGAPTDYSTAKSAIIALAKNMARKLAPNVRVNVIAPGNVIFPGGSWYKKYKNSNRLFMRAYSKKYWSLFIFCC